jgi:Delta7-sterol 5-desaturase
VFKYVHLAHHRSIAPTPWAIYAFEPLEAVIQFLGIYLIVFLLPLHPLALLAFLAYDTEVNTAGHTGYEVLPSWIASHWLYRGLNTVRHHDAHHTDFAVNFGSFFNVWDRWMGTFYDAQEPLAQAATAERSSPLGPIPFPANASAAESGWPGLWRRLSRLKSAADRSAPV